MGEISPHHSHDSQLPLHTGEQLGLDLSGLGHAAVGTPLDSSVANLEGAQPLQSPLFVDAVPKSGSADIYPVVVHDKLTPLDRLGSRSRAWADALAARQERQGDRLFRF